MSEEVLVKIEVKRSVLTFVCLLVVNFMLIVRTVGMTLLVIAKKWMVLKLMNQMKLLLVMRMILRNMLGIVATVIVIVSGRYLVCCRRLMLYVFYVAYNCLWSC